LTIDKNNYTWIPVSSNKQIPDGLWLVVDDTGELQVANFKNKSRTIGHYFDFDTNVVAYTKLIYQDYSVHLLSDK
jgi:hypothetical protein